MLAYGTSYPPGRTDAGRQQIRDGRPVFEAHMLELGAIALDRTASTDAVADQLLSRSSGVDERGPLQKPWLKALLPAWIVPRCCRNGLKYSWLDGDVGFSGQGCARPSPKATNRFPWVQISRHQTKPSSVPLL